MCQSYVLGTKWVCNLGASGGSGDGRVTTVSNYGTYTISSWGTDAAGNAFCCNFQGGRCAVVQNGTSADDYLAFHYTAPLSGTEYDLSYSTVAGCSSLDATSNGSAGSDEILGSNTDASSYSETLNGDADADEIDGQKGDDWIYGHGGEDDLVGGRGEDQIYGGDGSDEICGDLCGDLSTGGGDVIFGGAGKDDIAGGGGADTLRGVDGTDVVCGDDGADDLYGGEGNDTLWGGAHPSDFADGGDDDDLCHAETELSCDEAGSGSSTRPSLCP